MASYFVGLRLTDHDDGDNGKEKIFYDAKEAALRAAAKAPQCARLHFWAAINMALYGQTVGIFKMFFTLGEVQIKSGKDDQIDPKYAYGGAYRVLGKIQGEASRNPRRKQ